MVEIPTPLVPFLVAHLEAMSGRLNPLDLVFPSEEGTPLYPKNVRRRHFDPALKALGITGIRQHDFRRTFIALHVEAGTHPKLVQDRAGHSDIKLTMDVYGRIAGKMTLAKEQEARFNALASQALPVRFPVEPTANSGAKSATDSGHKPAKDSDSEGTT